jgi:CO/xanthine dehydrogenase Mo-binding subunit
VAGATIADGPSQSAKDSGLVRWLGSFDAGRILSPNTAASQFRGVIMGLGLALVAS